MVSTYKMKSYQTFIKIYDTIKKYFLKSKKVTNPEIKNKEWLDETLLKKFELAKREKQNIVLENKAILQLLQYQRTSARHNPD